jgi:hypothetical protein
MTDTFPGRLVLPRTLRALLLPVVGPALVSRAGPLCVRTRLHDAFPSDEECLMIAEGAQESDDQGDQGHTNP